MMGKSQRPRTTRTLSLESHGKPNGGNLGTLGAFGTKRGEGLTPAAAKGPFSKISRICSTGKERTPRRLVRVA